MRTARMLGAIGVVAVSLALAADASAQRKPTKPEASQGASVSQTIGGASQITIVYHRPGVKGRNVWEDKSDNPRIGPLVPKDENPTPWRAGANEVTKFTITDDVLVEGKELKAGDYGLYMIPHGNNNWTIVFNKNANTWGIGAYKKDADALRVDVKSVEAPMQEWLMYSFDDPVGYGATVYLRWEKVKIPFKVELKNKA